MIRELIDAGYMHADVATVSAGGLRAYAELPAAPDPAADGSSARIRWSALPAASGDDGIVRGAAAPFSPHGGLALLTGNLGRSVIKTSSVPDDSDT